MKISNQAKEYIQKAMYENNVTTLRFFGIPGCCGVNLGVSLQEAEKNDVIEQVNEIKVAIQPDVKEELGGVSLEVEEDNGEMGLVLMGYNSTCC
ncbi:Fe-S cluster assembly protein HesB [Rummeliibacillus suwonensis]|uniref:Fe-S cluster assembly protein HesB n=1 Tax=Rummeliibacillus suwonensis TaxID=1306154 RepID=UPI001AAE63A2|nr:Fe-S cluster assembly protein HesB [Rummeliibacillus suwonensis]MBO2537212.1 Fe-S cluster assembly protein HesB [Rummeliibacillus suwonensis]